MIIIVCWLLVLHFSSCIDGLASLVWIFEIMQKSKNNFSNFERARQKLFTKKNMENKKCPKKCDTTSVKKTCCKKCPNKGWVKRSGWNWRKISAVPNTSLMPIISTLFHRPKGHKYLGLFFEGVLDNWKSKLLGRGVEMFGPRSY